MPLLTCVRWLLAKPNGGFNCRQKGEGRSRVEGNSNHQWGGTRGGAKSNLKTRPSRCMIISCNTPRNAPSLFHSVSYYRSSFALQLQPGHLFSPFFPSFFSFNWDEGDTKRGDVKSAGERRPSFLARVRHSSSIPLSPLISLAEITLCDSIALPSRETNTELYSKMGFRRANSLIKHLSSCH